MNRQEKKVIIDELIAKINQTDYFYITDPQGMTVEAVNNFRRACFETDLEYKLYKNTFLKQAFDGSEGDYAELEQVLKGYSAVIFSQESANLPAKTLKKYYKDSEGTKPTLKAASINVSFYIGEDKLKVLEKIKSKNELIADLILALQTPLQNVVSALQSGQNTITGVLKTLAERNDQNAS